MLDNKILVSALLQKAAIRFLTVLHDKKFKRVLAVVQYVCFQVAALELWITRGKKCCLHWQKVEWHASRIQHEVSSASLYSCAHEKHHLSLITR